MDVGIDQVGDIAILNFHKKYFCLRKLFYALKVLKNKNLNVILEKKGFVSGELRKTSLKHLLGERRKETIHNENGCKFFLDVDKTYFSPRLANERNVVCSEIAKKIRRNQRVLVMFAGIAPFPIVLGKKLKQNKKFNEIISSELNKEASEFAIKNIKLNKLNKFIKVVVGDSRKLKEGKFKFIIMARPNLDETFLKSALKYSIKGTKIYYYGFGSKEKVLEEIKKDSDKKIGRIKIRKAGDIGPKKWRWLAEFIVR